MLATRLGQVLDRNPEWLSIETDPAAESSYRGRYLMMDGEPFALGNLLGQGDEALVFELIELRSGNRESVIKICRHRPGSPKYLNWAVPYRIETNPYSAMPEIEMTLARLLEVPGGLVKIQDYQSSQPDTDPSLYYRATPIFQMIDQDNLTGALKIADRLIKKHGSRPELLEAKGTALAYLERWEDARPVVEQVLETYTQLRSYARFRTAILLATIYLNIYDSAPGEGSSIELDLGDGHIHKQTIFMDVSQAAQDDTLQDKAMYVLLETLADEPYLIPALEMLVSTLLDTWGTNMFAGKVVEAIEKIDPDSRVAKEARAYLEELFGDGHIEPQDRKVDSLDKEEPNEVPDQVAEAMNTFSRLYQPEPEEGQLAHARYQSALSHLAEGRLEDAEKAANQAIKLDSQVVDYRLLLAEIYRRWGKEINAFEVLQKAVLDFPDQAAAYQKLGDYYLAHSDFNKAERVYLQGLYCAPEEPWRLKLGLGEVSRGLHKRSESLQWLHAAYRESAQDPNTVLALFYALCADQDGATSKDIQEAAEILQLALNLRPDVAEYWVCQAQLQARTEHYPDAINSLKRAIQINPSHPFAADFLNGLENFQANHEQPGKTASSKSAHKREKGKTNE